MPKLITNKLYKFMLKIHFLGLISVIISATCLFSCQENSNIDSEFENTYETYIYLPDNINLDNLSESNLETVFKAAYRIKVVENKDGLLELKTTSAQSINISENILEYYKRCIKRSNDEILSSIAYSRTNMLSSGESGDYYRQKDCVVWSIVGATGRSYDEVNSWVTSKYGYDGIRIGDMDDVLRHFSPNMKQIPISELPSGSLGSGYIVAYGNHVVNAVYNGGGNILYHDYQNNSGGYISLSEVLRVYKL